MSAAFDTLKFARALREKANMSAEQAEGVAEAFAEASADQLATKADLAVIATKSDLAETKAEILKWMFGTIGFQTVVILGAALALSRFGH